MTPSPTVTKASQTTGMVASGDVTLFFRHFGRKGGAPIIILHGANYFDSADWIDVSSELAAEREVVAIDQRGFGESSWSRSGNYSNDANVLDALAVLDHFGWRQAVILGHSRGGSHATLLASHFPERVAGLVLADYCPGAPVPAQSVRQGASPRKIYPTLDAVEADLSRSKPTMAGSPARTRLESLLAPVEGGFILAKRDPDFMNATPWDLTEWKSQFSSADMWKELAAVRAPCLIVRGMKSNRYSPETVARVQRDFPDIEIVGVDSGHDVAAEAPQALTEAVSRFLANRVDRDSAR